MPMLGLGERDARYQSPRFRGIVVLDGCFQMLAERIRLPELAAQPTEQTHRRLIGHGARLDEDARGPLRPRCFQAPACDPASPTTILRLRGYTR